MEIGVAIWYFSGVSISREARRALSHPYVSLNFPLCNFLFHFLAVSLSFFQSRIQLGGKAGTDNIFLVSITPPYVSHLVHFYAILTSRWDCFAHASFINHGLLPGLPSFQATALPVGLSLSMVTALWKFVVCQPYLLSIFCKGQKIKNK